MSQTWLGLSVSRLCLVLKGSNPCTLTFQVLGGEWVLIHSSEALASNWRARAAPSLLGVLDGRHFSATRAPIFWENVQDPVLRHSVLRGM